MRIYMSITSILMTFLVFKVNSIELKTQLKTMMILMITSVLRTSTVIILMVSFLKLKFFFIRIRIILMLPLVLKGSPR